LTVSLHRIRTYEDLDGAQGREVYFRPHRYRVGDLAPLKAVANVRAASGDVLCQVLDVSQNGVAMEWPVEVPVSVGDPVPHVSVKFDEYEAYAGEAHISSVREAGNALIVGLSFEGPLVSMDDVLELRTIKAFAEETSKAWGDGLRWKDKLAAGFTNSQGINGDKLNSLVSFAILAAQHGMHWISLGLYPGWSTSSGSPDDLNRLGSYLGAMAQSHGDQGPDVAPRASDLQTAEELGRRVALAAQKWVRGQETAERAAAA